MASEGLLAFALVMRLYPFPLVLEVVGYEAVDAFFGHFLKSVNVVIYFLHFVH